MNCMVNKAGKKAVELLWRKEKYKVMYYNQNQYNQIRQLMRDQLDDVAVLKRVIRETYQMSPTIGSKKNSYQHMWGYFKKVATSEEKSDYQIYISDFEQHEMQLKELLINLSNKYNVSYLKNSSILFE